MAPLRVVLVLAVLTGAGAIQAFSDPRPNRTEWEDRQDNKTKEAEAEAAREAKMAAVNKVITMLEDLQSKVMEEGEAEATTYNKYACFCKDTTKEKTQEIQKGDDDKSDLSAKINSLSSKRDDKDTNIKKLTGEIEDEEKLMQQSKENRTKDLKDYEVNNADLEAALDALNGAIKVLKASEKPSLAQLQSVAKTVRTATMLADALGLAGPAAHSAASAFLQMGDNPEVNMEDYKFHSGDIITTLEKLLDDFRKEKAEVDAEEVKSVAAHEAYMQEKHDLVKAKNVELDSERKEKDQTVERLASASEELTTVAADLLDDQQYLTQLSLLCSEKAKTYDQRVRVRQDELSALTAAIAVVKDSVKKQTSAATIRFAQQGVSVRLAEALVQNQGAMEAVEAEAEEVDAQSGPASAPPSFLQSGRTSAPADGRAAVIDMLRSRGSQLHSTLLASLASQIAADPFAKIKVLIQELIERLLQEAANEANQKGWCDKATADAEQKRDYAAQAINQLNSRMAELEARIAKLTEEISTLSDEIADIKARQKEAQDLRDSEQKENKATVEEAQLGHEAVSKAIEILDRWYKTAKKETVDLSLSQGPADDLPDAGFKTGEAYTGAQGEAGGIIGMLEVIQSDFERTISETEKAEAKAAQEHMKFMTESGMSLAEKETSEKEKTRQNDDAKDKFDSAESDLDSESTTLETSLKELMELKPTCVDTGMSYEERVARREDEIESLNKALCILDRYAQYGPEGAAEGC